MATPFDEIRDRFLSKIMDYDFISLEEEEINQLFDKYLLNAIPKFRYCRKDLSDRDEDERVFNTTLDDSEKDILSSLCVLEWLNMQVENKVNFQKYLSTKDFNIHSPAAHLKEMRFARDDVYHRVNTQINFYRFDMRGSGV